MKKLLVLLAMILTIAVVAACAGNNDPTPPPATEPPAATEAPAATEPPTEAPDEANDEDEDEDPEETPVAMEGVLPRNETLFTGIGQWGTPISSSPFHANPNNPLVIDQAAHNARLFVNETLFMFNMLDSQLYPLLAYGQPIWNDDFSVLTINLNPDAHWSDGTPVTARDVVVTFDKHVYVGSPMGVEYAAFISQMVAVDDTTVEIHHNPDNPNVHQMMTFLPRVYIMQGAFIEERWAYHGGDIEAFRSDPWENAPHSGPYRPIVLSNTQVVLERDDNYWGQAASMWGRLPVPRFIAHNIYADNDAMRASFAAGQIDVTQAFMANVWELWETDGLPISTFLHEAPYHMPGTMPSIWFNTTRPGLDRREVRQAIAFATDFELIIASAMSGYSPRFADAPRSIALPLPGEQRFVDNAALAHLQWDNADIDRANALLDAAGIVDTTGNGIRDIDGVDLSFTLMCPAGWTDWTASLEIVAQAGAAIGIELTTTFVEASVWTENRQAGNFDIIMDSAAAINVASPWFRAFHALYVEDPDAERVFWAHHRMQIPEALALIREAATETNHARLVEIYTEISYILLYEMPLVYLMYRPVLFHTVNESVWTGFPEYGDGLNIPPTNLASGFGIAGLYHLRLVD